MDAILSPNSKIRNLIETGAQADSRRCWTCGSCDFECPINIATGRLRPQKIVRLANLGLALELTDLPEIWYCLTCRRCAAVCPNRVKPAAVIGYARFEAIRHRLVSMDTVRRYYLLFARFQRVRWHAVEACLSSDLDGVSRRQWCEWLEKPVPVPTRAILQQDLLRRSNGLWDTIDVSRAAACFTCGECSSACPVSGERSVFDPRHIFHMANLGMLAELLQSPSIWLCVDCGRCTETCSQLVDGRQLIRRLQELAIESGIVDKNFRLRLERVNRTLYTYFINEIDGLFGFNRDSTKMPAIGSNPKLTGDTGVRPGSKQIPA
jgi:heterodisulfide reductase subunit C